MPYARRGKECIDYRGYTICVQRCTSLERAQHLDARRKGWIVELNLQPKYDDHRDVLIAALKAEVDTVLEVG